MGKTIKLFMWSYQQHFRIEFELRAKKVLERAGCSIKPMALLVGIRAPDSNVANSVCIEPENDQWNLESFQDCEERSKEIHSIHPDHKMYYSDAPSMISKSVKILKSSIKEAVEECAQTYDFVHNTLSFCGNPTLLNGYFIVPILQFRATEFKKYSALVEKIQGVLFEAQSLGLHYSIIMCLLQETSEDLEKTDPGHQIRLIQADPTSILREAAIDLCRSVVADTNDVILLDLFEMVNSISSLSYEGSNAAGSLLFVSKSDDISNTTIRLTKPVRLSEHKLVRKLIEMSEGELDCIYTGEVGLTGLGNAKKSVDTGFRVVFSGHYKWELHYANKTLMISSYGVPQISVARLERNEFTSLATRIFKQINSDSLGKLWTIVDTATEQKKGTLIVISADARNEAARLHKQCLMIDPVPLDAHAVELLTRIDGAILVDPYGVCHAIGVILDGLASDQGDMSRGARYNSAIRYLDYSKAAALCVVVSEDGYVNLLPDLMPQISRQEIDSQIELLKTQNTDNYHNTRTWLDEHRFYLNREDCDAVNFEISRIEDSPLKGTEIRIVTPTFSTNPSMNESYYLPN